MIATQSSTSVVQKHAQWFRNRKFDVHGKIAPIISPKNLTVILNNLYINLNISSGPVLRIRDPVSFSPLDPGWVKLGSGSGMNSPDHIFESLETIFWVKILKFFDADTHPGSATL
jgi:hypothetical protein